jgi:hypothetical protein
MARKTQLKLCNHVAAWMESYFVQTCVAQNIFAQHDWLWTGPFTEVKKDWIYVSPLSAIPVVMLN